MVELARPSQVPTCRRPSTGAAAVCDGEAATAFATATLAPGGGTLTLTLGEEGIYYVYNRGSGPGIVGRVISPTGWVDGTVFPAKLP